MVHPHRIGGFVATNRDIASRRTLALVGPSAAGKTSLAEALLWKAGAVGAPGSVEKGSTPAGEAGLALAQHHGAAFRTS
jgi:peptide subunit release factor RF-3